MGTFKALVLLAILAVAVSEDGALLPTPLPSTSNSTVDPKEQSSPTTTEVPKTTLSPSIPVLSVMQEHAAATTLKPEDSSKQGRAMNALLDAPSLANTIQNATSSERLESKMSFKKLNPDLSDVSMDNDDMDLEFVPKVGKEVPAKAEAAPKALGESRVVNKPAILSTDKSFSPLLVPSMASARDDNTETACHDSGISYKVGQRVDRDCEETCTCKEGGVLQCEPRCHGPYFRRGRKVEDPLCSEKVVDSCCAILVCAADTGSESCISGNKTYSAGEMFDEGCKRVCQCMAGGSISCKARCPVLEHRDECVNVTDANDSCCMVQLCDVSQDIDEVPGMFNAKDTKDRFSVPSHEETTQGSMVSASQITGDSKVNVTTEKPSRDAKNMTLDILKTTPPAQITEPISSVDLLSNGTVEVVLRNRNQSGSYVHLELSKDGGNSWKDVQLTNGQISGLEEGKEYMVRSRETGKKFFVTIPKMIRDNNVFSSKDTKAGCMHKGKHRSIDEEFHMGCDELCLCQPDGSVECAPLQCPSTAGLDVLDSSCVQWGPDPPDFRPHHPHCCAPAMKCISNGSCDYQGHMIPNWSEVPTTLSGCQQRCFCESGTVECQAVCAPLPALPPPSLRCPPPMRPAPQHPPGDTCCKEWTCVATGNMNVSSGKPTDFDKDKPKDFYRQNDTDRNNILAPPLFVTLPPDLHKAIHDTFGETFVNENKKQLKPKYETTMEGNGNIGPYFVPHSPSQAPGKPEKTEGAKQYDYPGPFADPNHKPPPPVNGLGPFPFIKKHKEKQTYTYETEDPQDFIHYANGPAKPKDNQRKLSNPNETTAQRPKKPQHSTEQEDYPINDPYLSGNPLHVPFNQNGPGPGFFNPSTTKNQQDLLNIYHQANANGNPNAINPNALSPNLLNPALLHPGSGLYNNGQQLGNQVPQGPETIHVYTDGSHNIPIEHILQHIQQADGGAYNPYAGQQRPAVNQRPGNDVNSSNSVSPGGFPVAPGVGGVGEGAVQVVVLDADSPTSLRLVINLPQVMVGLQGRVVLRYTSSNNPDPSTWRSEEFSPPNDLLATPRLEFQLGSLQPDTLYKVQAAVHLPHVSDVPKSHIYTVRTPPEEIPTLQIIPIEPNMAIEQVSPTSAQVTWRPFNADELQYVDGIQLRYREIDGKVYSGTPLIHRGVTTFQLEGLKANTSYEVGIFFIPFLGQHTELQSRNMVHLNTPPLTDMYDWAVLLDVSDVSAWGLTLQWTGVPRPAERYVHVYRAVWRAEAARADRSSFSLPARDAPPTTNVTGLTPGTRYRIWLELYLTNGKVKTSNVKDVMTKPGKPAPQEASVQEGKVLEGTMLHQGDYYSSLVAVGVLAALGVMTSLVLLLLLLRRHRTASAPICSPTAATRTNPPLPPYDSPTYKLDLQQETMDL